MTLPQPIRLGCAQGDDRRHMTLDTQEWLTGTGLSLVSLAAQGVWTRACCAMWRSPERGYLLAPNRAVPTEEQEFILMGLGGHEPEVLRPLTAELVDQAVLRRDPRGVMFNQSMVDFWTKRATKVRAGRLATGAPADGERERRSQVPPRVRFLVLQRDNFTCRYCGRSATAIPLNVDHILAVAAGGTHDLSNLVTACFDCNIGKGSL